MDDSTKVSELLVRKVPDVGEFEGLEGEALDCLGEGSVDILVGDAGSSAEEESTARGQLWGQSCWLSQSLGGKVYKVTELQLPGIGEPLLGAGELGRAWEGGEGRELGHTQ